MPRNVIYSANVTIEGLTELLMHKCGNIGGNGKVATSRETDYSEEWVETTYTNPEGHVCLPSMNLEAMLRDASKGQKIGKHFMSKLVPTGCMVREFEPVVTIKGKTITIDDIRKNGWIRAFPAVVVGKRVMRIRTSLPAGWRVSFTIDVISRMLTAEVMENLMETAGYSAGLCDWRPGAPKPGKFGQFEPVRFEVQ